MLHETTEHHDADSKCNTGGDSQKISNEEKHQRIEENVNKTLKIGPFSVWALGNASISKFCPFFSTFPCLLE